MRHVVDAIAAQGRNGDDELLHISKAELRDLKTIGNAIGIRTTVNPKTGIHEAFNWGKMLATAAGGTVGFVATGFNPMGAAAGAALASGAYTGAEGGSTQDILMNAAISGATAYAGAGIAQGLGEAGAAAAEPGAEIATQGTAQTATGTVAPAVTEPTTAAVVDSGVQGINVNPELAASATTNVPPPTTSAPPVSESGIAGVKLNPNLETAPVDASAPAKTGITGADIVKGFQNTSGKDLISQYGASAAKTGVGLATLGAMPSNYGTDPTETPDSGMNFKAETYVTADGQRRTRAVPMAGGGLAAYAQGDSVDTGIASMARGRYLQGPGDGMSDSIPAHIDGKQPARLATGEFVVPADVVSGLGNGDSTSGAKQLHSMMDRVRMDRTGTKKQGKQINPRKLMPA